jgi:hypothetical protein
MNRMVVRILAMRLGQHLLDRLKGKTMPCRDYDDWRPEKKTSHGMTFEHFEAAMCGILGVIEKTGNDTTPEGRVRMLFNQVDWNEAGVPRRLVEIWWRKHKEDDRLRREREEAERTQQELRKIALSKLTADERRALGL